MRQRNAGARAVSDDGFGHLFAIERQGAVGVVKDQRDRAAGPFVTDDTIDLRARHIDALTGAEAIGGFSQFLLAEDDRAGFNRHNVHTIAQFV